MPSQELSGNAGSITADWRRATLGDEEAQSLWSPTNGGDWRWHARGISGAGTGTEWSECHCSKWIPGACATDAIAIEVTVRGRAEAAGLSFGAYKDFLVDLRSASDIRHLRLAIHPRSGTWSFHINGVRAHRCWWDAQVRNATDLLNGSLGLKAKGLADVSFEDLRVYSLDCWCRISVILVCYRYLQRLRVSLRNWCNQTLDGGNYEILVVNPQSPDGTHEYLNAVADSYPEIALREVIMSDDVSLNKGMMLNRAFEVSRGEWIWLTDADCLFDADAARNVLTSLGDGRKHLFFGKRWHLTPQQTAALLSGRVDGLSAFHELAANARSQPRDFAPWGYTQIIHRSTLEMMKYKEDTNHFAYTDNLFVADCATVGVTPQPLEQLECLHLAHPFAWHGTDAFL